MRDTNELFNEVLEAYRNADDPDRFLREFLIRLDDATSNAVVATERKLDRLDAARARLDAAREIPRPDMSEEISDTTEDFEGEPLPDVNDEEPQDEVQDLEPAEDPPKKRRASKKAPGKGAPKRARKRAR
jgi:hypothetical protein